jgi:hypothetical protein
MSTTISTFCFRNYCQMLFPDTISTHYFHIQHPIGIQPCVVFTLFLQSISTYNFHIQHFQILFSDTISTFCFHKLFLSISATISTNNFHISFPQFPQTIARHYFYDFQLFPHQALPYNHTTCCFHIQITAIHFHTLFPQSIFRYYFQILFPDTISTNYFHIKRPIPYNHV